MHADVGVGAPAQLEPLAAGDVHDRRAPDRAGAGDESTGPASSGCAPAAWRVRTIATGARSGIATSARSAGERWLVSGTRQGRPSAGIVAGAGAAQALGDAAVVDAGHLGRRDLAAGGPRADVVDLVIGLGRLGGVAAAR
ncbi:MAG: hypothetical protein R2939_10085 [Kofleriaceae bacterium]